MRIRELVIICAGALVLLSGCTHTTPFTDDHYFRLWAGRTRWSSP